MGIGVIGRSERRPFSIVPSGVRQTREKWHGILRRGDGPHPRIPNISREGGCGRDWTPKRGDRPKFSGGGCQEDRSHSRDALRLSVTAITTDC